MAAKHIKGRPVNASTYVNHGCRCDGCRIAHSAYQKKQRHKNPDGFYATELAKSKARYRLAAMYHNVYRRLVDEEMDAS